MSNLFDDTFSVPENGVPNINIKYRLVAIKSDTRPVINKCSLIFSIVKKNVKIIVIEDASIRTIHSASGIP